METNDRRKYALGACGHVAYEIKMFLFCITELIKREKENKPRDNYSNALVESFALHFRNLHSFFTGEKKTRSFVDENVYYHDIKQRKYGLNADLSKEYSKANKGIAHIDRGRTEQKQDGWDYPKLYSIFKPPILDFIDDPDILPYIKEIDLISEIKGYCDSIDCFLNDSAAKGLEINKVDTTSGSVSVTSSTIQS